MALKKKEAEAPAAVVDPAPAAVVVTDPAAVVDPAPAAVVDPAAAAVVVTDPAADETEAKKEDPAPAEKASEWPKFLRSATGFGYCDPTTQIRYSANPVRVDAAPKEGSWLDCQLKAKYIVPA